MPAEGRTIPKAEGCLPVREDADGQAQRQLTSAEGPFRSRESHASCSDANWPKGTGLSVVVARTLRHG
jgi:hypothetical protein